MAMEDDDDRVRLSRRAFLQYGGATLALLGVPGCRTGADAETGARDEPIDVTGLAPTDWIDVWRADDLLLFRVGLYNFARSSDGASIVRQRVRWRFGWRYLTPGLLAITFPPQHVQEAVSIEGSPPPPVPVATDLAAESRIVLYVPDGVLSLPLDLPSLLAMLRTCGMNVEANAAPPDGVALPPDGAGTTSGVKGHPVEPLPLETAIELPWRLQLSPNVYGRWAHADAPVTSQRGRVELWHTRLATVGAFGTGVDERSTALRTTRAIWSRPGSERFVGPLAQGDRDALVNAMANNSSDGPPMATMPIDRLALSALGGWLDANTELATGPIAHWYHHAAMGRDVYVEVAYRGMACPFKHKVMLLKISERKLHAPEGDTAFLWQRHVIVPTERTRVYDDPVDPAIARQLPLRSVTLLDRAILIDPPGSLPPPPNDPGTPGAFVPSVNGVPVPLAIEAIDGAGNLLHLRAPIVWVPTTDWGVPLATYADVRAMYAPIARVEAGGQRLQLAPPQPSPPSEPKDNTTFPAHAITFDAASIGGDDFHPVLGQAELAIDAVRHVVGNDAITTVTYASTYLQHDLGGPENVREVFLELAQPISAGFATQADKLGSFVSPSFDIKGLSRTMGPVSQVDPAALASTLGDPSKLFNADAALDILKAKLFGCMPLDQILDVNGLFEKLAPKFVTDAMHEVDRYRTMIDRARQQATAIQQQITSFKAGDLGKLAADVQAEVSSFADELVARVDAIVQAAQKFVMDVTQVNPGGDVDAQRQLLDGDIDAITLAVRDVPALWTSSKALPYVYPYVPGLEATLRDVTTAFARVAEIADDVKGLLDGFLRGLELAKSGQVTIDWTPPLRPFPPNWDPNGDPYRFAIFRPHQKSPGVFDGLTLRAVMRGTRVGDAKPGVDLICTLEKFDLVLVGQKPWVSLKFDKLAFRRLMGKKPEVDVVFKGLEFGGPLAFIETLKDIIPLDGFSDPPGIDVSPSGIVASYSMALPDLAIGMFSLENMAISARLDVPFLGDSMALQFAFCSRAHPFALTVCGLGGGGFFDLEVTPKGLTKLEAQLEFGARVSIDLGVASGSISIMGGVYFGWFDPSIELTGFIRFRGEVSVLDLISASIELYMALEYRTASGDFTKGKVVGRAYLEIEVSVAFFSKTVRVEVERKLAGAAGDPSFQDTTTADDWSAYRAAFAAAA